MTTDEERQLREEILSEVLAQVAPVRQTFSSLTPRLAREVDRFKAGDLSIAEMFFWQKSFARTFLAFADALSYAMSRAVLTYADQLHVTVSRSKRKELDRPMLSLAKRVDLGFAFFPLLFACNCGLVASPEDRRGFQVLIESREQFTHPKQPQDLCPPGLLAATLPTVEWFFTAWTWLLFSCAKSMGHAVMEPTHERRFRFNEEEVGQFAERLSAQDATAEDGMIRVLSRIIFGLTDDTKKALRLISAGSTEAGIDVSFAIRNAFFTVFSDIEGSTFALAYWLHRYCEGYPRPDRSLLTGRDDDVRDRIVSTLESFSREFGTSETVSKSGPEWESFASARRIRDKMTHPKGSGDWSPHQEDLTIAIAIHSWWHLQVRQCMKLDSEKVARLVP